MKRLSVLVLGLVLALCLCAAPSTSSAQVQDILGPDMAKRFFLVAFSGSIDGRNPFSGVRHQVIISFPESSSPNPLQVIINPLPALGAKNSIYWNSEQTRLRAFADTVESKLVTGALRQSDMRFYSMSPALYANKGMLNQQEPERIRWIDTHAKPIAVLAQTAELTLHVTGNLMTGTVRITGMDKLAHKPCQYVAQFQGQEYVQQQPKP